MTKQLKTISRSLLAASACALLAACQTGPAPEQATRASKIDSALQRAAYSAAVQGEKKQSLSYLERIYKRKSDDPIAATAYAAALREADYTNRASIILAPFADDERAPAVAKTEYAAIQLALGNYEKAEKYAQNAVLQDDQDARAYHYLGIALDAQSMHEEAERAFRKGLDHWQGDPTTIMNNLALNLASQGFLDEAIEILRKAQAVSPDRVEIERNLRIVTALLESQGGRAPKPAIKPAYTPPPKLEHEEPAAGEEPQPEKADVENVEKEELKLNE